MQHSAKILLDQVTRSSDGIAWKICEEARAERGISLPDWAPWCFFPIAGWLAALSRIDGTPTPTPRVAGRAALIAALGAWRMTQGVYRFDPSLYTPLIDTPSGGDIPADVLLRLPEWCIYIELPGIEPGLIGAWVHLEDDANTRRPELRILAHYDDGATIAIPLHLGPWGIDAALQRFERESMRQAGIAGVGALAGIFSQEQREKSKRIAGAVLSLALYLCSQGAEIGDGTHRPGNPQPQKTKRGPKVFPASSPTTWNVGVRIGAAIRAAADSPREGGQGGTHATPRPHVRRAHWHGFRSGPLKRPDGTEIPTEQRRFDVRWMPPIPVNVTYPETLPATVRPVKK